MRWIIASTVLAACSTSVGTLSPPDGADASISKADAAVPDPKKPFECPKKTAESNQEELWQLGLSVSHIVFRAELRVDPSSPDSMLIARVDRVFRGMTFMEGVETLLPIDPSDKAGLDLPGVYLVGIRGNPYPTVDSSSGRSAWWQAITLVPGARQPHIQDSLGYRIPNASVVASVEIERHDEDRVYFRTIEAIVGEAPGQFADNWTRRVYTAPFPGPSRERWIATLYAPSVTPDGTVVGSIVDFRPDTAENRAVVQAEVEKVHSPFDGLQSLGRKYRTSWNFGSAPHVVATTVRGIAGECCTGAGGTYVAHRIDERLRGATGPADILCGGHAYYGDERCGDGFFIAAETLAPVGANEAALGCGPSSESLMTGIPSTQVIETLPRSPETAMDVKSWVEAPNPLYELRPDTEELVRAGGPEGPWSRPMTVTEALAAATHFSVLTIQQVRPLDGATEVTVETTFTSEAFAHLTRYRRKLVFGCGDERLLKVGATYLGAVIMASSRSSAPSERAFLVPGVLLPNTATTKAIQSAFGSDLSRMPE